MYAFEYDFFPKPEHRGEEWGDFDHHFNWFLSALRTNGQLLGPLDNVVEHSDYIRVQCIGPAPDALDPVHYNVYCRHVLPLLLGVSTRPPEFRLVGEVDDEPYPCSCPQPGSYILRTVLGTLAPPVDCGDCNLPVPLYQLPYFKHEEEYYTLLKWDKAYQACDELFMQCYVGERWSYRQMANVNSDLTRWGREICAEMAARKGKPFYYYLLHYYATRRKSCPGCGGPWQLPDKWHDFYAFKCDTCFLVSNAPYSEPAPLSSLHP